MAQEDSKLIRIAPDFTWLSNNNKWPREDAGIPESRWSEYRILFTKLSLSEGILKSEDFPGAIFLLRKVKGLCTGGTSSGYVYSTTKLDVSSEPVSAALQRESQHNPSKHSAYTFKALKESWYAFYEVDW
jgi:hypothetical protein